MTFLNTRTEFLYFKSAYTLTARVSITHLQNRQSTNRTYTRKYFHEISLYFYIQSPLENGKKRQENNSQISLECELTNCHNASAGLR